MKVELQGCIIHVGKKYIVYRLYTKNIVIHCILHWGEGRFSFCPLAIGICLGPASFIILHMFFNSLISKILNSTSCDHFFYRETVEDPYFVNDAPHALGLWRE